MKIFSIQWDSYRKTYYYIEVVNDYVVQYVDTDLCDKSKKNEPIKKFNRWFDKFNITQTDEVDEHIINIIYSNFVNIANITPNDIKYILKSYKLNKYYKMIPSIYCRLINEKFFIPENVKNDIKSLFSKVMVDTNFSVYINYNFFVKNVLTYMNYKVLSDSIPSINSLEKCYEYMLMWRRIRQILESCYTSCVQS